MVAEGTAVITKVPANLESEQTTTTFVPTVNPCGELVVRVAT